MKKIVIIDDEQDARENLRQMLAKMPGVEIIGEADSVSSAHELLKTTKPDALLLDITLNDGTGFDLLDHFPTLPFRVIFVTAHDSFSLRAFRYNALDYLLKPISQDLLEDAISRIETSEGNLAEYAEKIAQLLIGVKRKTLDKLSLHSQEGMVFVRLDQVVRLQSDGNYTTFFMLNKEKHVVSRLMKDYEEMLPNDGFFRIHQTHLVNLSFVKKYLKEDGGLVEMEGGVKLPIARRRKDEFLDLLESH